MKTNNLDILERVTLGKTREEEILLLLMDKDIKIGGKHVEAWVAASEEEDKLAKIDAHAVIDASTSLPVQIKYRDDGRDIGIAAVMPYINHDIFKKQWEAGKVPWDRDMRGTAQLLVCLSADGGILTICDYHTVKRGVRLILEKFARLEYFDGRSFSYESYRGAEIRVVKDHGGGYSAGKSKLIVYFTPRLLKAAGAYVFEYYGSPEEMEPGL